ncbi:MAG: hypothetical protein ACOC16_01830 [Nanoarchaeota archaeon]
MIISHKHKFIFVKPTKVAGTSVEINLSKQCGKNDIITKIDSFNDRSDSTKYKIYHRNISEDLSEHLKPQEIKKIVGNRIWDEYYKIGIVRNPWDQIVSRYFYDKYFTSNNLQNQISFFQKIKRNLFKLKSYLDLFCRMTNINLLLNFNRCILFFNKEWSNYAYYFDKKGNRILDYYIRFENLEEDYKELCKILKIDYEKLPLTKNKQRTSKKHYSYYYSNKNRLKINKKFKKEIKEFKYKFEIK